MVRLSPSATMLPLLLLACGSEGRQPFVTATGAEIDPRPGAGDAAVAWIFVTTDCPVANGYAPAIEAIGRDYASRGVRVIVVHVDPTVGTQAVAAHTAAHGYTLPVIVDRQHRLVTVAGVTVTPEAAVFDGTGQLRYRGRIDDQYQELGVRRPGANTRELRDALDAVLEGRPVPVPRTTAVGCVIEALAPR